jgi:hypothetical protein
MPKYLPGYSYGLSGGPPPLSWRAPPGENDYGLGTYVYEIWEGKEKLRQETFRAYSLRHSQEIADRRRDEKGGSFSELISYTKEEQKG